MTEPTTPDLAAIRARLDAVPPAPWHLADALDGDGYPDHLWVVRTPLETPEDEDRMVVSFGRRADGEFTAHAREDVPALLALVDRLAARVVELEAELRIGTPWACHCGRTTDRDECTCGQLRPDDEAAQPDGDEWVCCAASHCPNAERFAQAEERGWAAVHMGTWLCPQHRNLGTVKRA